jgi:cellobiose phosphorylase
VLPSSHLRLTPLRIVEIESRFFGRDGSLEHPDSLNQIHLDNLCGAGLDPCGALQVTVSILPGEERDVVFLAWPGRVK